MSLLKHPGSLSVFTVVVPLAVCGTCEVGFMIEVSNWEEMKMGDFCD